ncbi:MAG: glycosyltransferase [Candidatus Coatesbacteria bacterium]|nr:glycosyltransferase [Candidatus Coatesbacteria bacterium]
MHIAIDARRISDRHAGMGVYTFNLLRAMEKIDTRNQYTIFHNPLKTNKIDFKNPNFSKYVTPITIENHLVGDFWRNFYLPHRLRSDGTDVFHDPGYFLPIVSGGYKSVVTVHDLVVYTFPQTNSKKYFWYMRQMTKIGVQKADLIIALSFHTKEDLIRILKVPESKVRVVYSATNEYLKPVTDPAEIAAAREKFGIDGPYILCVNTIEPRKNLPRLLSAYHLLKTEMKLEHKLVVCGMFGWLYGDVFTTIRELGLEDSIIFTSYVKDEDLPRLYSGADLFVFPSLYEGFGLPALEAMACGAPVITSSSSSLPEIVGDAAIMINPYSIDELAEAMFGVLTDKKLRDRMRRDGLARASLFSWEKTASHTLSIYEELYATKKPAMQVYFEDSYLNRVAEERPLVSIIIVNWNVKELLISCIESIRETAKSIRHEIIVVDNNSHDGSVDALAEGFPDVKVIKNLRNAGFAVANNVAARRALGRYICFLNPDTIIHEGALQAMIDALESDDKIGLVGPKLLNEDGSLQPSARNFLTNLNLMMSHLMFKPIFSQRIRSKLVYEDWDHNETREVDWLVGACLMLRRTVLEEIGPFDEGYFMFHEDTDLCYRTKKAGYKVFFVHDAEVVHFGGRSCEQRWGDFTVLKYLASKHIFIRKHYGRFALFTHRALILGLELARLAAALIRHLFSLAKKDETRRAVRFYRAAVALELGFIDSRDVDDLAEK